MVSKKVLSMCASIIILYATAMVGCGGSNKYPFGGPLYVLMVGRYTMGTLYFPVAGVQVQELDNDTGDALTGVDIQTSDANGMVYFVADREIMAFKVIGGDNILGDGKGYVDTYQWNQRITDQNNTAYLLEFVDTYLGLYAAGDMADYVADNGEKAVFASHLVFTGPNGPTDTTFQWQPVGCATAKFITNDASKTENGVLQYYNKGGLPDPTNHATPKENGGFSGLHIIAGSTIVKAYNSDGDEITDPDNPNIIRMVKSNDASNYSDTDLKYPTGAHPAINIANVYIKASATNPEAACTD
jgi:hypothetical protein